MFNITNKTTLKDNKNVIEKSSVSKSLINDKSKSTKSKQKTISNDFQPRRFGVQYDPPTIIMEYLLPATGKLYHHKMKISKLNQDTPTSVVLEFIKKNHFQYLCSTRIPETQIITLINKLKSGIKVKLSTSQNDRPETASTVASQIDKKQIIHKKEQQGNVNGMKQTVKTKQMIDEVCLQYEDESDKDVLECYEDEIESDEFEFQREFDPQQNNEWDMDEDEGADIC